MVRLVFNNSDATPMTEVVDCSLESVPLIMAWYGGHFSGDRYTVTLNARNVPMNVCGEPIEKDLTSLAL